MKAGFLKAVFLAAAMLCGAQEPVRLHIPKVSRAPKLEDFVSGAPREAEAVITDFRQFMPVDGAPVSAPTTAYLSYDGENIYAGFVCKDDPALMRAHITRRDKLDPEDRVSLSLDTFHDRHRCYWFDCNPYACQQDGMTIDGVDDYNWDAVWTSQARRTPDGYVALITVPFRSLRYPAGDPQLWGFSVVRLITRNNELSTYPPISMSKVGWASQFGDLEGIRGISRGSALQFIPYGILASDRYLDEDVPGFKRKREGRAGLDARLTFRDAFTLDATVRPDFSQVESDQPQVTVNQRFETIYPEKRPFFLENANLFNTPTRLFFSRRITDPHFGARLTGKVGAWALGAVVADDWAPGEQPPGGQSEESGPVPVSGHRARVGVLRVFRESADDGRLGLLVSDRELGGGSNQVVSLDSRLRLGGNWVLESQWMNSRTRRLDGGYRAGPAALAKLDWGDNFSHFSFLYEDRSEGFNSDLGYVDRVGIRRATQYLSHVWRPNLGGLVSLGPTLSVSGVWNREGVRQNWEAVPGFEWELTRQTHIHLERSEAFERYLGLEFRRHMSSFGASSDPLPWLGLSAGYSWGTGLNYDPAPALAPFLGEARSANVALTLRPDSRFSLENAFLYSQLRKGGENLYIDRILRSKWNYQFTRELSLRAIFDYNLLDPDPRFLDPAITRDRRFNADVLLAWVLHPGTALYVGLADLCRNRALDPTKPPSLRITDGIGLSTGTQAYVKVSYLIRP